MRQDYIGYVKTNYGPNKLGVKKAGKVKSRRYVRHKNNQTSVTSRGPK